MQDRQIGKLIRAAEQRLTSAGILANQQMHLDAMYIAGYAPECALKAVILSHVPVKSRARFQTEWFCGAEAHDFEHLKGLMRKVHAALPADIARQIRTIATWSTNFRYETGKRTAAEAHEFLNAAKQILQWAKRSV